MNALITAGIRILEVLFFGGCVGSFIVVVIAGIEDFAIIFERGGNETGGATSNETSSE